MLLRPSLYPADWKAIVARVRERSGGQCECRGECGLHRTYPGPRRCEEMDRLPAKWAGGRVILTTAHRDYPDGPCDCEERTGLRCGNLDHLAHLCNRCHLRWDVEKHQKNARATRRRKALTIQPEFFAEVLE